MERAVWVEEAFPKLFSGRVKLGERKLVTIKLAGTLADKFKGKLGERSRRGEEALHFLLSNLFFLTGTGRVVKVHSLPLFFSLFSSLPLFFSGFLCLVVFSLFVVFFVLSGRKGIGNEEGGLLIEKESVLDCEEVEELCFGEESGGEEHGGFVGGEVGLEERGRVGERELVAEERVGESDAGRLGELAHSQ